MNLRPSTTMRLASNALGQTVTPDRSEQAWRHPWWTELQWLPVSKRWVAFTRPGFINGFCPVVTTTAGQLREAQGTFFGQLVDAKSGADEIAQLARLASGGVGVDELPGSRQIDVPLYRRPPIGLQGWRKLGWDGEGVVPEFFVELGVAQPPRNVAASLQGGRTNLADLEQPRGNRLLRALDIWVQQPRTALTSSIEITPEGAITGGGLVRQSLGIREPLLNQKLRVQVGNFKDEQDRLDFATRNPNLIAGEYEERTWDDILIATVYLVSPAGAVAGSPPDGSWEAYVAHHQFWNLSYAQRRFQPFVADDIFRSLLATVSVLGGGAGSLVAGWITSSINDATQGAINILQAQSLRGSFWTATGGGTVGSVPESLPEIEPEDKLNKAARRAAKERQKRQRQAAQRLDPPFPHNGRSFNLSLLS